MTFSEQLLHEKAEDRIEGVEVRDRRLHRQTRNRFGKQLVQRNPRKLKVFSFLLLFSIKLQSHIYIFNLIGF